MLYKGLVFSSIDTAKYEKITFLHYIIRYQSPNECFSAEKGEAGEWERHQVPGNGFIHKHTSSNHINPVSNKTTVGVTS